MLNYSALCFVRRENVFMIHNHWLIFRLFFRNKIPLSVFSRYFEKGLIRLPPTVRPRFSVLLKKKNCRVLTLPAESIPPENCYRAWFIFMRLSQDCTNNTQLEHWGSVLSSCFRVKILQCTQLLTKPERMTTTQMVLRYSSKQRNDISCTQWSTRKCN